MRKYKVVGGILLAVGVSYWLTASPRNDESVHSAVPSGVNEPTSSVLRSVNNVANATFAAPRSAGDSPHVSAQVRISEQTIDLSSMIERTHFSFQPDHDVYVGGDTAYGATVQGERLSISPKVKLPGLAEVSGEALSLGTLSLNGHDVDRDAAAFVRTTRGTLSARISPEAIETLENTRSGLEQSWTFNSRPSGHGDLVIAMAAEGAEFVGETSEGLHFRDPDTGLGLRYSQPFWIDASGNRVALHSNFREGRIEIRVPGDVLDEAAYPAVLDPTISAEYDLDAPIVGPAADLNTTPAIGHSGTTGNEYLVIWQDRRRNLNLNFDVFGAHVDRNGNILDSVGALISPIDHAGNHTHPRIAFNAVAGKYGIVFQDDSGTVPVTQFTQLGATGFVTTPPSPVFSDPAGAADPDIAWNSNATGTVDRFAVTWSNTTTSKVLVCIFSSASGCSSPVSLSTASLAGNTRVVASNTSSQDFLVMWTELPGGVLSVIKGRVFGVSGGAGATTTIAPQSFQDSHHSYFTPDAGFFDGSNKWLVAYEESNSTTLEDIDATTFSTSGALGGVQVFAISNDQHGPSVAGFGPFDSLHSEVLLSWFDFRASTANAQIFATRVQLNIAGGSFIALDGAGTGVPLSNATALVDRLTSHSDDIDHYFVVWPDQRSNTFTDIYGNRMNFNGTVDNFPGFLISTSANKQSAPSIVRCGGKYMAVWTDTRNGFDNADVYGAILDSSGAVLVNNIAVSTAAGRQDQPDVACNGTNFYVVWVDERNGNQDIYGTGIDGTTGAVLNSGGVPIATTTTAEKDPAIAFSNTTNGYMVVWDTGTVPPESIAGATISSTTGLVVVPSFVLPTSPSRIAQNPDIAFDGTNYLVVWHEGNTAGLLDIYGDLVSASGTPGSSSTAIDVATGPQRFPKVTFNNNTLPGGYEVVFEDDSHFSSTGTDIRGRFIDKTTLGTIHAYFVAQTLDNDLAPRITFRGGSGGNSEVLYSRVPTGSAQQFEYDVYGQTIATGVPSGSAYAVSTRAGVREMTPDVACATKTSCVDLYREFDPNDVTTDIDKIQARTATFP